MRGRERENGLLRQIWSLCVLVMLMLTFIQYTHFVVEISLPYVFFFFFFLYFPPFHAADIGKGIGNGIGKRTDIILYMAFPLII